MTISLYVVWHPLGTNGLIRVIQTIPYFHHLLKIKQSKNCIKVLQDNKRKRLEDAEQIKRLVVDFYQGLLGTRNAISLRIRVNGYKQRLLTMKLDRLCSSREKTKPLDQMASLQKFSSRSSRLSNLMWWLSLHTIVNSRKLLFEVNSTPIAFVPKVPNPSTMADIKPIECGNVVYKYITKILQ